MRTVPEQHFDHSGGVQAASGWLLRGQNEVEDVINARFDDEIGVITRRNGRTQKANTLQSGKPGLGLHESKFSTGAKTLAAINNSGDTATVIKGLTLPSTWADLTLPGALPVSTEINFADSLDETYAAGISAAGNRTAIINIKNDLTTSITRNLIGAPKARFITEYGGKLHAMNVELGGVVYANRDYISSPALSVITYTRGDQITLSGNVLAVDTVRYLKAGMAIDIYNHITGSAIYSNLTIASVDKAKDTITLPQRSGALTFTAATTDLLTVSSTSNFPTGTAVVLNTAGTMPGGLTADIIYYVINISGTTMKLATTAANATAGTAIDVTSTGSGTHTVYLPYTLGDNEEIYLTGRYGELCYLWNTDYPSADKAEYLKIPSGATSNSAIIGYGKSNNRLFMFTSDTTHKWDGSQLITLYGDRGCANHETIQEVGDWLIWLDTENRVNARNDSTGQKEVISRAIRKKYMQFVPNTNYPVCAASTLNSIYKLHLGSVTLADGSTQTMRVCYDFDANTWTRENHTCQMLKHMTSNMSGFRKVYFLDEVGKLWTDDIGDLDDTATIPFLVRYGRNNSGTINGKTYSGYDIIGQNLSGALVKVFLDGEPDPIEIGKLTDNYSRVHVGNTQVDGRDITLEITHNAKGSPIAIEGYVPYLSAQESSFGPK